MLESLEKFQDGVNLTSGSEEVNDTITFAFKTFAIRIEEIDPDSYQGQSFSVDLGSVEDTLNVEGKIDQNNLTTSDTTKQTSSSSSTASIQLPENLFEDLSTSSCGSPTQARVSYSVFLSDALFQNEDQKHLQLGSIIVSARLRCDTNATLILKNPIEASFRINGMVNY